MGSRRRFVICSTFLFSSLVLAQVELTSSLCDPGSAQERTLHWANLPDDPTVLSLIRSASHRPLALLVQGWDPLCASEDLC